MLAVVLPLARFDEAALTKLLGDDPGSKPRVLILFNVPRLRVPQQEAIARFLAGGGGVLVTLGDRPDVQHYNDELYRGGEGWLPAKLGDIDGDEVELSRAAVLLPESFQHKLAGHVPQGRPGRTGQCGVSRAGGRSRCRRLSVVPA